MADENHRPPPPGPLGRALDAACRCFALAAGAIFAALTLTSAASIVGRLAGRPLQGDFELVQFGCAVAIAFCLPYCQLMRGNIIVDFFTVKVGPRARGALDAVGALLVALVMGLVAWRTAVGAVALAASGETSMITGVPIWYAYALMTPALALTAAAGLYTAWQSWASR